ncbi:MAG TPA: hypothetical protein VFM41_10485 [Gaiella sp.]|nr:hypothetical protein [Gaiella sp.]
MVFWIALAVLVAGVVGGLVYAVMRGISFWRQLKRTKRGLTDEAERIQRTTEEIQVQLDRAGESSALLGEAAARLAVSRAKLEVQLRAVREARHTVRRVLWFLPGI